MLELVDVIGQSCCVICLTNRCHLATCYRSSKATLLDSYELLIVMNFIMFRAVWTPLLYSSLVMDGPHGLPIPQAESDTVTESEVPVADPLVRSGVKVESSYQDLPDNKVEGGFCVQKQDKERLGGVCGVLNG